MKYVSQRLKSQVPSWPRQAEEEGKVEVAPRRVGSGRVLSEAHVLEREAGRGLAVEEARTMMEKMRVEERQQLLLQELLQHGYCGPSTTQLG